VRRWKLLVAVAAVAMLIAVFVIWPRPDRVTRGNFDRIKNGMSRAEVEAILGPPGDYRNGPSREFRQAVFTPLYPDQDLEWVGDDGWGHIICDSSGHVLETRFYSTLRAKQTAFENLLWRLKRQWHRWFPE
jgi:hypothetical protein